MSDLVLPHKLTLNERKSLNLTGVTEVISFDENTVMLSTTLGTLEIQGEGLQLKTLSIEGGQVVVDGDISALIYSAPKKSRSFWQRLTQ